MVEALPICDANSGWVRDVSTMNIGDKVKVKLEVSYDSSVYDFNGGAVLTDLFLNEISSTVIAHRLEVDDD